MREHRGDGTKVEPRAPSYRAQRPTLEAALRAQAEASGAGYLLCAGDEILSYDEGFRALSGAPGEVLATGSVSALVRCLREATGATGAALADLLTSEAASTLEIKADDGRVLQCCRAETRETGASATIWTFRDVSLQSQATRALRDAENWLQMFSIHTDGVVLELDAEMRITGLWGRAGISSFLGRAEARLQGRPLMDVVGERLGPTFREHLERLMRRGATESFEFVVEQPPARRCFEAHAALLPVGEGQARTVTMLVRDVTERKRMQTQLLRAERLASAGLLAAGVAHEINNPLAYMLLNLEHIQARIRSLSTASAGDIEDLASSAQMTLEGAKRVQEIVKDLRQLSQPDSDAPSEPVEVRRVLEFATKIAAVHAQHRAHIVHELSEVPRVQVSEARLIQVFLNLIVNAAQAIPEGDPEHNEIRVVTSAGAGSVIVEVRDTGAGMSESTLRQIFDPFFTTKPPGVGTGLGLPICHTIVSSFGGDISVHSKEGAGSVFRVVIPIRADDRARRGPGG